MYGLVIFHPTAVFPFGNMARRETVSYTKLHAPELVHTKKGL
jgi:hypothetical protein